MRCKWKAFFFSQPLKYATPKTVYQARRPDELTLDVSSVLIHKRCRSSSFLGEIHGFLKFMVVFI